MKIKFSCVEVSIKTFQYTSIVAIESQSELKY